MSKLLIKYIGAAAFLGTRPSKTAKHLKAKDASAFLSREAQGNAVGNRLGYTQGRQQLGEPCGAAKLAPAPWSGALRTALQKRVFFLVFFFLKID